MALSNPPVAGCHFAEDYSAYPTDTQRLSGYTRAHHDGIFGSMEKRASGNTLGTRARIMADFRARWKNSLGCLCAHHDGFSRRLKKLPWGLRVRIMTDFPSGWKNFCG